MISVEPQDVAGPSTRTAAAPARARRCTPTAFSMKATRWYWPHEHAELDAAGARPALSRAPASVPGRDRAARAARRRRRSSTASRSAPAARRRARGHAVARSPRHPRRSGRSGRAGPLVGRAGSSSRCGGSAARAPRRGAGRREQVAAANGAQLRNRSGCRGERPEDVEVAERDRPRRPRGTRRAGACPRSIPRAGAAAIRDRRSRPRGYAIAPDGRGLARIERSGSPDARRLEGRRVLVVGGGSSARLEDPPVGERPGDVGAVRARARRGGGRPGPRVGRETAGLVRARGRGTVAIEADAADEAPWQRDVRRSGVGARRARRPRPQRRGGRRLRRGGHERRGLGPRARREPPRPLPLAASTGLR